MHDLLIIDKFGFLMIKVLFSLMKITVGEFGLRGLIWINLITEEYLILLSLNEMPISSQQ